MFWRTYYRDWLVLSLRRPNGDGLSVFFREHEGVNDCFRNNQDIIFGVVDLSEMDMLDDQLLHQLFANHHIQTDGLEALLVLFRHFNDDYFEYLGVVFLLRIQGSDFRTILLVQ